MKCKRCKRPLKNPKSINRQYGPVCFVKVFGKPISKRKKKRQEEDRTQLKLFEKEEESK